MADGEHEVGAWRTNLEAEFRPLSFLFRSENRIAVLEALHHGPWGRQQLRRISGTSRPTLSRILGELEEYGWVERNGREYTTTTTGSLVIETVLGTLETMGTVSRLESVFRAVPRDDLPGEMSVFSDATVSVAEPGAPTRPIRRLGELLKASETLRELIPLPLGQPYQELLTAHLERGGTAEIVCHVDAIDSLAVSPEATVPTAIDDGRLTVQIHDAVPFRVISLDDNAVIVDHDERTGAIRAVCEATTPATQQWADTLFERVEAAAESLTVADAMASELEESSRERR